MNRIVQISVMLLFCMLSHAGNVIEKQTITVTEETADTIVQPQYPGGDVALKKFLKKNLQYPNIATEFQAEGECFMEFTINTDGSIVDVMAKDCKLYHYNHAALEKYPKEKQEALKKEMVKQMAKEGFRLIRKMKKWTPGSYKGQPVKVKYTLPISFGMNFVD